MTVSVFLLTFEKDDPLSTILSPFFAVCGLFITELLI